MVAKGEAELDSGLRERIVFQSHNFFEENPVSGPAIFLLRLILHDWPDGDAIEILRQLVPKMSSKTRLIINDAVMPEPGATHPLREKSIRNMDMIMMCMFNGLERTRQDWEDLIHKTDSSLRIAKVETPHGSALSLLEIIKT